MTDELELITSELVTNAVQHTRRPTIGALRLRLLATADIVRVEVFDSDARLPLSRMQDLEDETGRGLHIVASLSNDAGAYRTAAGKCVWSEVTIPSKSE
jgi:anti-sigma regulatory factor (Ser/Thr protein kinase)